jgi:hypothetical protein
MSHSPLLKSIMRKRFEGTLSYVVYVNTKNELGLHVRTAVACTHDYEEALEQQVRYTINEMYGKYITNWNTLNKLSKKTIPWSRKADILRYELSSGLPGDKPFEVVIKARKFKIMSLAMMSAASRNKPECRSIRDYATFYYRCKHQLGFHKGDRGPLIDFL